ncbi:hypothetical protein RUND412_011665, partial [Rhizina undulata]
VLLDYDADVNGIDDLMRPIVVAARKGQVHMIQFLLRKGADICINAPEHDLTVGARALASAVYLGLSPVVRVLVEAGVPPNNPNESFDPVLCAMSIGQHHVLETLFELGAKKGDPLQSIYSEEFRSGPYPDKVELQVNGLLITRETCRWVG